MQDEIREGLFLGSLWHRVKKENTEQDFIFEARACLREYGILVPPALITGLEKENNELREVLHDIRTNANYKKPSINKIKDGVKAKEVDKAARDFIDKKGFARYFIHGVGHGIGLYVHETPLLSPKSEEVLKSGMVVTIEPAVYLEGKFGMRIENMVLVNENKGEILSGSVNR